VLLGASAIVAAAAPGGLAKANVEVDVEVDLEVALPSRPEDP
jgi:hypothetical protein